MCQRACRLSLSGREGPEFHPARGVLGGRQQPAHGPLAQLPPLPVQVCSLLRCGERGSEAALAEGDSSGGNRRDTRTASSQRRQR